MKKGIRSAALLLAVAAVIGTVGLHLAAAQDKKAQDNKAKPAAPAAAQDAKGGKPAGGATATFELYKDSAGEFRFRLKDGEGSLLATSGKGYKTKADCQKVIDTIKRDVAKAKVDDMAK